MEELPMPTVLSIAAVPCSPSVKSLQFSQDGQVVLLTKYAAHILTPSPGIAVESSSVIQHTSESVLPSRSTRPLGWFRTVVEFDRSLTHVWPSDCTDWGAVSLGSLDPSLQAVALSPSNITADAGCVLVLLNSNLELTIWSAGRNLLTREWLQDVTDLLRPSAGVADSALAHTLRLQSNCIEWSSQPYWNIAPTPLVDASLLAVGNRAGCVTLLRYDKMSRQMAVVKEVAVSDKWITQIAWSPWHLATDGTCEAVLSCGASDGSVALLTVRQTLSPKPYSSRFGTDHEVGVAVLDDVYKASNGDRRSITGMRWASVNGRTPILIYHKPGVVHLWSAPSPESVWSGSRALTLRTQKRSVGSSALLPVSGISCIHSQDLAVVSLSDGSFHVIHNFSVDPSLDPPASDNPDIAIQSEGLSAVSRSVFVRAEQGGVSFKDVDRVNGAITYDGGSTFLWTYEAMRPTDFSYKHDARHVSTFVVAQLWNEDIDERVIGELRQCVSGAKSVSGETPASVLRPIFLHMRDADRISRLHARVLDVLYQSQANISPVDCTIDSYTGDWTSDISRDLQSKLTTHLFGWQSVHSLRICYALSAFCQAHAEAPDVQQKFAEAVSLFLAKIRMHVQLVLIRHLSALSGISHRSADDISFARRIVRQAVTTPEIPPSLTKEAEQVLAQLPPAPHPHSDAASGSRAGDPGHGLSDQCPACHAAIPLAPSDAESAMCANGHVWARCCVTSFILATPMVRTCVGCSRKALLPPAAAEAAAPGGDRDGTGDRDRVGDGPKAPAVPYQPSGSGGDAAGGSAPGRGFVQDLLDAVRRCPYCGNNFVVLL